MFYIYVHKPSLVNGLPRYILISILKVILVYSVLHWECAVKNRGFQCIVFRIMCTFYASFPCMKHTCSNKALSLFVAHAQGTAGSVPLTWTSTNIKLWLTVWFRLPFNSLWSPGYPVTHYLLALPHSAGIPEDKSQDSWVHMTKVSAGHGLTAWQMSSTWFTRFKELFSRQKCSLS